MGKQTPEKRQFDELAWRYFDSKGYCAAIISGRLADVVAWHPVTREFVIAEVKTPCEKNAAIGFVYKKFNYNLANQSRPDIWQSLKLEGCVGDSPGIERLIAFTVTNQLYRYCRLSQEHVKKFCGNRIPLLEPKRVVPFLFLPIEHKALARKIIDCLRPKGVELVFTEKFGKLLAICLRYSDG